MASIVYRSSNCLRYCSQCFSNSISVTSLTELASLRVIKRFISSEDYTKYGNSSANSSTNHDEREYVEKIMKNFLFYIHPDYFHNHKAEQSINNTNLSLLRTIFDHHALDSGPIDKTVTHSITFYIKPETIINYNSKHGRKLRKVKVSTVRALESIEEILEALGKTLPVKPAALRRQNKDSSSFNNGNSIVLADPHQILAFLQSLNERKELVIFRKDRVIALKEQEQQLLSLTGVSGIEYHTAWSAQNNAVMLARLNALIREKIISNNEAVSWTGMRLVFTKDTSYYRSVDYTEGTILLNPSEVPAQWLSTLLAIDHSALMNVARFRSDVREVRRRCNDIATAMLSNTISDNRLDSGTGRTVKVRVRKGFTCSIAKYIDFLKRLDSQFSNSTQLSNNSVSQMNGNSLQTLPLLVSIIIEDTHGNKLLPNGDLQLDFRSHPAQLRQLIERHYKESTSRAIAMEQDIHEMTVLADKITNRLQLKSLRPGIGSKKTKSTFLSDNDAGNDIAGDARYLEFLRSLDHYLSSKEGKAAFRYIGGLELVAGHYLGFSDDGACILPWDFSLPY